VRRRPTTNGNGTPPPSSGVPLNGSGSPGGGLAIGQGPAVPGGSFGGSGDGVPMPVSPPRAGDDGNRGGGRGAGAPGGDASFGSAVSAGAPMRKPGRLALSNWRVRWRLFAIIAVPTVTALILGVIQNVNADSNFNNFNRVHALSQLGGEAVTAVARLEDERDATAGYIASGKSAALRTAMLTDRAATMTTVTLFDQQAQSLQGNGGYPAQTLLDLQNAAQSVTDLTALRKTVDDTSFPAPASLATYDRIINDYITFSGDIAVGSGNVNLENLVGVKTTALRISDDVSQQQALLYEALEKPQAGLTPVELNDLNSAVGQQNADQNQFGDQATVGESQTFNNTVSGQQVDEAEAALQRATTATTTGSPLVIGQAQQLSTCPSTNGVLNSPAQCWNQVKGAQLSDIRTVINGPGALVSQIQSQAGSLASQAQQQAILIAIATILLLSLVLLITILVARSMIRPLRRLRADALEIANTKLPEMVRRLSESEGGDESVEIEPVGVTSTDEIGEVARAFDQVHREAVRLAADEAMLRGNLNAMFVNLSRRSQSLIERQLTLIDNLEQSEQDADRLSSLFRLDHLATRMRRNSENLLVLAGHDNAARRWTQPVPLVDVLRAAISEIEQYERVVLNVQPGIQVIGQAVNDIVHLVAEIVENATTFSPEDTQVYVTGQPLNSGGVLLDITDNGVGISEQEMAHANWRLDNPPVVDVAVSRRMGLFVVGRLAARHGVRVRLRHAQSGGLTALIWLPEAVAAPENAAPMGRLRKFESDDFGQPSLSAAGTSGGGVGSAPGGPGFGGSGFGGGAGSGFGGAGSRAGSGGFDVPGPGIGTNPAAAAAARIPRLAPGGGSGGNGFGGVGSFGGADAFDSGPGFGADYDDSGPRGGGFGAGFGGDLPTRGSGSGLGGGNRFAGLDGADGTSGLPTRQPGGSMPPRPGLGGGPGAFGAAGDGGGPAFGGAGSGFGDDDFGTAARSQAFGAGPAASAGVPGPGNTGPASTMSGPGSTGAFPTLGGPSTAGSSPVLGARGGSDGSQVTIPPSVSPAQDQRLPIFDSLESDWFRRSGKGLSQAPASGSAAASGAQTGSWNSAADEGWRAAQVVASPAADETTTAGLPKRVPRANLVPGSVGGGEDSSTEAASPARSAEDVRSRMASFQRGVREARAAAPQNEEP
jgi:signal transduction histidine kinase